MSLGTGSRRTAAAGTRLRVHRRSGSTSRPTAATPGRSPSTSRRIRSIRDFQRVDFFRGGVTKIVYDPNNPGTYYFSMFGYGLFRHSGAGFENIYQDTVSATDLFSIRYEFDTADLPNGKTRIFLGAGYNEGDATYGASRLYRVDDASAPAASLTTGGRTAAGPTSARTTRLIPATARSTSARPVLVRHVRRVSRRAARRGRARRLDAVRRAAALRPGCWRWTAGRSLERPCRDPVDRCRGAAGPT